MAALFNSGAADVEFLIYELSNHRNPVSDNPAESVSRADAGAGPASLLQFLKQLRSGEEIVGVQHHRTMCIPLGQIVDNIESASRVERFPVPEQLRPKVLIQRNQLCTFQISA